jgi:hypothetical protein
VTIEHILLGILSVTTNASAILKEQALTGKN